jgi:hypothetical protein
VEEEENPFQVIEVLEKHGVSATVRPRPSACGSATFRTSTSWRVSRKQDVEKLKKAGFHTVGSLIMECKKSLTQARGLSEAKVEKILDAAAKISVRIAYCRFLTVASGNAARPWGVVLQNATWMPCCNYAQKRKTVFRIGTGSKALDAILGTATTLVSRRHLESKMLAKPCFAGGGVESGSLTEIAGEFRSGKTQLCHQLCITAQLPLTGFAGVTGGNGKVAYACLARED